MGLKTYAIGAVCGLGLLVSSLYGARSLKSGEVGALARDLGAQIQLYEKDKSDDQRTRLKQKYLSLQATMDKHEIAGYAGLDQEAVTTALGALGTSERILRK
ncbi:MAG: hypothetical protein ABIH82_02405 [Candidatus Woesearchaeota archaeon]